MKTAVITGGTRGIGFGIASSMARDGYNLVLGYLANTAAAERAREQLEREHGVQVICVPGDTAAKQTMVRLFEAVEQHFHNELTAFVHSAGLYVGITTPLAEGQPDPLSEDFEEIWDYYQQAYPRAFKRGLNAALKCEGLRHVIAISSPGCNATMAPQPTYEAPGQGKSAVEFLVRLHARLLAPNGINVNCVVPGFTKTEAWEGVLNKTPMTREELEGWSMNSTPAKRWGEPSEIGDAVAFLCSDRARFVTGVSLPVDGGLHLNG